MHKTWRNPGRMAAWAFLGAVVAATLFPFYWMIRTALTPAKELFGDSTSLIPGSLTTVNFERILGLTTDAETITAGGTAAHLDFLLYLRNSLIYSVTIAVAQTLFCAAAGYALSRLRFRGRQTVFALVISALMVPPIFTLLPNFVLVKSLDWLNTWQGILAPMLLMTPFAVFFLRQFFLSIPREIEEAAYLDGAGVWRQFTRIILPMNKGPLLTIGLITAVNAWKDYLWPVLVGKEENIRLMTAAIGILQQSGPNTSPDWTGLMAASVLTVIPVLLLLLLFGRRLVESISFTGVK
ncbi:carbohydrate ABC transporter permease [Streptomyces sp. ITFR-16]|uniref:carbohydrate ABC transporter permease n=1 Tax=Streptomyces sp. ITFR-16 TaxID=3075198 RepID=UPI00288C61F5|nr:carbohydrate ABC transporter permease [Streptomyces sp. ITFR-16]WNI21465.1 carbohydrate ABC transporter permease [Streptomyces sp. ITFR-16]